MSCGPQSNSEQPQQLQLSPRQDPAMLLVTPAPSIASPGHLPQSCSAPSGVMVPFEPFAEDPDVWNEEGVLSVLDNFEPDSTDARCKHYLVHAANEACHHAGGSASSFGQQEYPCNVYWRKVALLSWPASPIIQSFPPCHMLEANAFQ